MPIGGVRQSQLITTYGVGATVPVEDFSVMVAGIHRWKVKGDDEIHEPRLERKLGVERFILPPATGNDKKNDVPCMRFPLWYWCTNCRRLDDFEALCSDDRGKCNRCGDKLVPSRFVIVCENGHIDDFPYFDWVHAGVSWSDNKLHELYIKSGGVSASLSDIEISCSCGVPPKSLEGAFSKIALKDILRCPGRRPWLNDEQQCSKIPRTLQRGASNVYFAINESALSIPPWSEGAYKIINHQWKTLAHIPENALFDTIEGMKLAEGTSYKTEDLVLAVRRRKQGQDEGEPTEESLRPQEYEALTLGKDEESRDQDFVCVPADRIPKTFEKWIEKVMEAKRLREVRALISFTRLDPPSAADDKARRAPLAPQKKDWLPAIEVIGEGIFLKLNLEEIGKWENDDPVTKRTMIINDNYARKFRNLNMNPDRIITPRLVMVHTLAHVLINQLSLDCGYPAASLRERLYVSEDMAGLLIYTASTDSAGSLGGIVAQADPDRLEEALMNAIKRTSWCSADPLCIETEARGTDALNLAACHACVLLPEVSCEEYNVLLDRALLVGTQDDPSIGFFSELVQ